MLLKEKEQILLDLVANFKSEREKLKKENKLLKARVMKLEQQRT